MKRVFVVPAAAVLGLVAFGTAACGSSGSAKAANTSSSSNNKAAFCAANIALDKAATSVNSAAGFLAVLKAHDSDLGALTANAPSGKVGTEAKGLVTLARNAVATNNTNELQSPPPALASAGADIDTYCGVDGSGSPLPADFGAGKSTAFCSVNDQISAGTNNAPDAAGVLTFLKAHQNLVTQFAADIPSLPSALQPEAQTLVTTAQSAISSNNADALGSSAVQKDSMDVDLYCGHNQ